MTIQLKSIVAKQIPEFAREDYPLFVSFVEAYYEYLDQYEKRNLTEIRDLDQTLDSFVQFFKNELDILGDNYTYIDQRLFLRKVKELFVSKGIEASYKFLFKLLYNKTAEISYPWDSVLKASDGKWQQEMSVFVDVSAGDINDLVGNRITITGPNIGIKVFVDRVKFIRDNIWEVFINKNYYGNIEINYTINALGVTGIIIPTTVSYSVTSPGSGYSIGDLITGTTVANGVTITQLLKVTKVDSNGGVVTMTTVKYGCGYNVGFYLFKSNVPITTSTLLTITKDSTLQYSLSTDNKIEKYEDYGYIVNPNYVDVDYSDPTYAADLLQQFYEESLSGQGENPDYLLVKFDIGAVAKYQGHYNSNDGFLDDDIFIQDSFRWQKFSYLITVDENLEKYKSLIKSYLHPAGTALFGEYQIQNTYTPGISASLELGQWRGKATFLTINKPISGDYAYINDQGGKIRIEPYDLDYMIVDEMYNPPVIIPFYGDGRNNLTSTNLVITDNITSAVKT